MVRALERGGAITAVDRQLLTAAIDLGEQKLAEGDFTSVYLERYRSAEEAPTPQNPVAREYILKHQLLPRLGRTFKPEEIPTTADDAIDLLKRMQSERAKALRTVQQLLATALSSIDQTSGEVEKSVGTQLMKAFHQQFTVEKFQQKLVAVLR